VVVEERFDHVSQAGVFFGPFTRGNEVIHMVNEVFFTFIQWFITHHPMEESEVMAFLRWTEGADLAVTYKKLDFVSISARTFVSSMTLTYSIHKASLLFL
jgi:hypothetical protein